jgi:hypothetical protein
MIKNKLQLYFDYYAEHHSPKSWEWYHSLKKHIIIIQSIKGELQQLKDFENLTEEDQNLKLNEVFVKCSNAEINTINDLLERYVFMQNNGIGDVAQGIVWDTSNNDHKSSILQNATPFFIYTILTETDSNKVNEFISQLLQADRSYNAVRFRFIRTLFPDNFASPDAPDKLNRLVYTIEKKLGISIAGNDLEKHNKLCAMISTDDTALKQIFTWELFYLLENEVTIKKAVCYYGAPGTGKTYQSSREAKKLIDAQRILVGKDIGEKYAIKTVQFHPSYSYEDFIEGIRPNKKGGLKLFNGSFKQFCKDNGGNEIKLYTDTNFLSNKEFEKVDFDFARIKINQLDLEEKEILGLVNEDCAEGLTLQDAIEPAFFIIDEINRAELSKVFGELMYSLEYRGYSGIIKTQYSHLCESEDDSASFLWKDNENWFFIPQNIYIISTMNNIDRSVDAFDFALRRRFMWKEVHPNYNVITQLLEEHGWEEYSQTIANRLESLNNMIERDDILDKNYRIGQSYVLELIKLNPQRFDAYNSAGKFIWDGFIAPLLEEYLKGLGNEQKSREKIEKFKTAFLK